MESCVGGRFKTVLVRFEARSPDQASLYLLWWCGFLGSVPLCKLYCSTLIPIISWTHYCMVWLFHTPLHTHLIALERNNKTKECGKSADKGYASEGSKDAHTHSQSHMGHSINELAVLMSAVEWMFTATLKPTLHSSTLSLSLSVLWWDSHMISLIHGLGRRASRMGIVTN